MFLGIRYNVWHAILVWPVVTTVFGVTWILGRGSMADPWLFLLGLALGVMVAHHLQSWNEARQAIDPRLAERYGSYARFAEDSREDWKWFWRGVLVCWLGPVVEVLFL